MPGTVERRLHEMGIRFREPSAPRASYIPVTQSGNLVFVSGHGPFRPDGSLVLGTLGAGLSVEEGYEAARLCAIDCLASLHHYLGDLDRVTRFLKLLGMVHSAPDFTRQPAVINGASDLIVELYGERGHHARSAVGMMQLPGGMAVELEMVVEVAGDER